MIYKAYWGDEPKNFGDILNKNILDYCDIDYVHTRKPQEANLFAIGSTIRMAQNPLGSVVLGSGIIKGLREESMPEELNPNNTYEFVRGPRTRTRVLECGGSCPEIYGDAALLVNRIVDPLPKKYKIGFTPHYTHRNKYTKDLAEEKGWRYIDVCRKDPLDVVRDITECEKIISTSLHGIIVAHAYGIPASHLLIWQRDQKWLYGKDAKFIDYYESVGLEHVQSELSKDVERIEYHVGTLPDLDKIESLIRKYANV